MLDSCFKYKLPIDISKYVNHNNIDIYQFEFIDDISLFRISY